MDGVQGWCCHDHKGNVRFFIKLCDMNLRMHARHLKLLLAPFQTFQKVPGEGPGAGPGVDKKRMRPGRRNPMEGVGDMILSTF